MANTQEELDTIRLFKTLKGVISNIVEHFDCNDEKLEFLFSVDSKPFEVSYKLTIHPAEQLLTIYSKLPFTVEPDFRAGYAQTICQLNYDRMYACTYDFSLSKGSTVLRYPLSYRGCLISADLLDNMIRQIYDIVTKYNEYLYDASRGLDAAIPPEATV